VSTWNCEFGWLWELLPDLETPMENPGQKVARICPWNSILLSSNNTCTFFYLSEPLTYSVIQLISSYILSLSTCRAKPSHCHPLNSHCQHENGPPYLSRPPPLQHVSYALSEPATSGVWWVRTVGFKSHYKKILCPSFLNLISSITLVHTQKPRLINK